MQAYRIVEWEHAPELVEAPVPEPGPGQVLVAVAGNGLCHSDALMSQMPGAIGESIGWKVPFTLGHEIGGRVASFGAGVRGFAEGDPVAVISPSSCGHCAYCVRGEDNNCADSLVGRGYGRDGGLATYVLVASTRELVKLTSLDPVAAGPLTDAGATSYHAVKRALPRIHPGGTAVVIGAGGLGSFAVQHLLALSPARVVAIDPVPGALPTPPSSVPMSPWRVSTATPRARSSPSPVTAPMPCSTSWASARRSAPGSGRLGGAGRTRSSAPARAVCPT